MDEDEHKPKKPSRKQARTRRKLASWWAPAIPRDRSKPELPMERAARAVGVAAKKQARDAARRGKPPKPSDFEPPAEQQVRFLYSDRRGVNRQALEWSIDSIDKSEFRIEAGWYVVLANGSWRAADPDLDWGKTPGKKSYYSVPSNAAGLFKAIGAPQRVIDAARMLRFLEDIEAARDRGDERWLIGSAWRAGAQWAEIEFKHEKQRAAGRAAARKQEGSEPEEVLLWLKLDAALRAEDKISKRKRPLSERKRCLRIAEMTGASGSEIEPEANRIRTQLRRIRKNDPNIG